MRFVIKQLQGRAIREATIYEHIAGNHATDISPRLIAVQRPAPGTVVLCIQAICRVRAWPWRDLSLTRELLRLLAMFHIAASASTPLVSDWDYDAELGEVSARTRTALDNCRRDPELARLAEALPAVTRMVLAHRRIRRELAETLGVALIHGDVHPGNALVRRRRCTHQPVLLD